VMQGAVLKKEWMEAVRSYRILIILLVFLFLGISQPLSYYFMPELLDLAGLPEGMVIEIPPPTNADILSGVLAQYNQVGILVIILVGMGAVNREIESGLAGFVTSLGVSRLNYLLTKWVVLTVISIVSVFAGMFSAAYYTSLLFQPVNWLSVLEVSLIYSVHAVMILTMTLLLSTVFRSQLAAAGAGILAVAVLSLFSTLFKRIADWLPNQAGYLGQKMLYKEAGSIGPKVLVTGLWIILILAVNYLVLRKKEI
jgi:ABC-2 type transport system permease protein